MDVFNFVRVYSPFFSALEIVISLISQTNMYLPQINIITVVIIWNLSNNTAKKSHMNHFFNTEVICAGDQKIFSCGRIIG